MDPGRSPSSCFEIQIDTSLLEQALAAVERRNKTDESREPDPEGEINLTGLQDDFILLPDAAPAPADPVVDPREQLIARLTRELADALGEREMLEHQVRKDRVQLAQVEEELDRLHQRSLREREYAQKFAHDATLKELLPFFENMERASNFTAAEPERFAQGIRMVLEQLRKILSRLGMERVDARPGARFDPDRHEALLQVPTDSQPPGSVLAEARPGWTLNGRLMKAAQVTVAVAPPPPPPPPEPPAAPSQETAPPRTRGGPRRARAKVETEAGAVPVKPRVRRPRKPRES